jgi:hypothetical protein
MNPDDISPTFLHQRWLHSHEEDTGKEMVFRPSTYNFPPSRGGRIGFELRPDGSAAVLGMAPTDSPQEHAGTWKIDAAKQLVVHTPALQQTQAMTIVSSGPDRLVVEK